MGCSSSNKTLDSNISNHCLKKKRRKSSLPAKSSTNQPFLNGNNHRHNYKQDDQGSGGFIDPP